LNYSFLGSNLQIHYLTTLDLPKQGNSSLVLRQKILLGLSNSDLPPAKRVGKALQSPLSLSHTVRRTFSQQNGTVKKAEALSTYFKPTLETALQ
jgi:hypothetical protein